MKRCIYCNSQIECDDNFCFKCGNITPKGYIYFKNNEEYINLLNGNEMKKTNRTVTLFVTVVLFATILITFISIRGQSILKPFIYIQKQLFNYQYGYYTSLISNNYQYDKISINTVEQAYEQIKKDMDEQRWKCKNNLDVYKLEEELSSKYKITSVNFCDISTTEVKKIAKAINEFFILFPNSSGYLTNLTITNAKTKNEYIAYFQPIYQFVNSNENIDEYNKINKTQILLNSYYFLNKEILDNKVGDVIDKDWYVKDATWESLIIHELGHYLTFVALLKENDIENITLVTKQNQDVFNQLLDIIDQGVFSTKIVAEALKNYNLKNKSLLDLESFTNRISNYASVKNENGELIADETIAEAVHDYYLHKENANEISLEIVKILKEKIGELM